MLVHTGYYIVLGQVRLGETIVGISILTAFCILKGIKPCVLNSDLQKRGSMPQN